MRLPAQPKTWRPASTVSARAGQRAGELEDAGPRPLDRAANLPRFPAVALAMPTSWTQEPDSSASRSKLARGQGASAVGAARGAALQRYAVAIRTVCRSGREERREWQKEGGGSSCGGDSDDGDIGRLVSTDLGEEVADELPQVPCVGTRRE